MAQALFITRNDLVKYTSMNGSVDTDNFIQYIKIAQDTHIYNYLGTDLYNKISADVDAGTLTGNYETLVETYIKPMLVHYAMVEYLPFAAYTVANRGIYKHSSENSESVSKTEVDYMVEKERAIAMNYTDKFLRYICNNQTLFPEYSSNTDGDKPPLKQNNYFGWVL